ncbi:uncharacterized protein LOC129609558 [Condylostylus longicornis]|uniref:uncharacterized protein LOC129609558 n=1 Tax=Condylostylus longicornis TaxID=2530218 RepID=UPI00244DFE12|nr:uncharacterized protein LOC129609558 [Condylostylus longicornis]
MQRSKLTIVLIFTSGLLFLVFLQNKEVNAQPPPKSESVRLSLPPIIIGPPIPPPPPEPPTPTDCTCESIQIFTNYVANTIIQAWCNLNQFLFNCIINAVSNHLPPYLVYCIQKFLDALASRICKTHY